MKNVKFLKNPSRRCFWFCLVFVLFFELFLTLFFDWKTSQKTLPWATLMQALASVNGAKIDIVYYFPIGVRNDYAEDSVVIKAKWLQGNFNSIWKWHHFDAVWGIKVSWGQFVMAIKNDMKWKVSTWSAKIWIVYAIGMWTLPLFYCNATMTCIYNGCNICQTKQHYLLVDFYDLPYFLVIERKNLPASDPFMTNSHIDNYNICND